MVSGQWNRKTVRALWQLTARYWKSEEKKNDEREHRERKIVVNLFKKKRKKTKFMKLIL